MDQIHDNTKPFARMGRKAYGSHSEIAGSPKYPVDIRPRLFCAVTTHRVELPIQAGIQY